MPQDAPPRQRGQQRPRRDFADEHPTDDRARKRGLKSADDADPRSRTSKITISILFLIIMFGGALWGLVGLFEKLTGVWRLVDVKKSSHESMLKYIFFSGSPYLVACIYPGTGAGVVNPTLKDAKADLQGLGVSLVRVECNEPMAASGRSAISRFSLPPHSVGFVVANRDPPVALEYRALKSRTSLIGFLENKVKPKVRNVVEASDIHNFCLKQPHCIVAARRGGFAKDFSKTFLPGLMEASPTTRSVKAVTLDTARFKIDIAKKMKLPWTSEAAMDESLIEGAVFCFFTIPDKNNSNAAAIYAYQFTGSIENQNSIKAFFQMNSMKALFKMCGSRVEPTADGGKGLEAFQLLDGRPELSAIVQK
eukprot:Selendium_serpulae@DN1450_c0_g1_i1.p1